MIHTGPGEIVVTLFGVDVTDKVTEMKIQRGGAPEDSAEITIILPSGDSFTFTRGASVKIRGSLVFLDPQLVQGWATIDD